MSTGAPDTAADIRAAVRTLCARYPGSYWRRLDAERASRPKIDPTALMDGPLARSSHSVYAPKTSAGTKRCLIRLRFSRRLHRSRPATTTAAPRRS